MAAIRPTRFHMLGMGSMGCVVAFYLRRSLPPSFPVHVVHRRRAQLAAARLAKGVVKVEHHGVAVSESGFVHEPFDFGDDPNDSPGLDAEQSSSESSTPIESLIVTAKAPDTLHALSKLLPRLSPSSTIVLLQNGMGIYELLTKRLFRNPQRRPHFIVTVNTHGAWSRDALHAVHAGIGSIQLGIMPDGMGRDFEKSIRGSHLPLSLLNLSLNDICDPTKKDPNFARYRSLRATISALRGLDALNVSWNPISEVLIAMRRKVVVNSVINSLTALLGCRNGDLLNTYGDHIAFNICKEAELVYKAQWLREHPADPDLRDFPKELLVTSLVEECNRVVQLTADNFSSMLADVRKAKETEIDFMAGYLVRLGKENQVRTPILDTLLHQVLLRSMIPLRSSVL